MSQTLTNKIKQKVKSTKTDIDRKILTMTNQSIKGLKTQVKKHTSLDVDEVDFNSELARNVAIKVLEKAQGIRKNLTKEELIKASKRKGQKVVNTAKSKIKAKSNKKNP